MSSEQRESQKDKGMVSAGEPSGMCPVKQYRIGELARFSGLSRQTIHNYTNKGLIQVQSWTPGGHRLYGEDVFAILARLGGRNKKISSGESNVVCPEKQYSIGEVARFSGLSRQTIHNYTIMGLIGEKAWTPGGHRLYGEDVFTRLTRIDELRKNRTLREVRTILVDESKRDQK